MGKFCCRESISYSISCLWHHPQAMFFFWSSRRKVLALSPLLEVEGQKAFLVPVPQKLPLSYPCMHQGGSSPSAALGLEVLTSKLLRPPLGRARLLPAPVDKWHQWSACRWAARRRRRSPFQLLAIEGWTASPLQSLASTDWITYFKTLC